MQLPNKNTQRPSGKLSGKEKPEAVVLAEGAMTLMDELIQLMNLEIEVVGARKMNEHKDLLKRKQRLTIDYRANMKSIAVQPDVFKQLPDNIRASLKLMAQKLAEATDRNAKFLRGAVMATQRLIQNIVSIVKQEVLPKPGYSNPGALQFGMNAYSPTCKPVAIDRTA